MNNLLVQEQKEYISDEIKTLQTFNDEATYQRLVSQQSNLASPIILGFHNATLHAGPNQILAIARIKYWISSCRNLIRKIVRNCVSCCRFQTRAINPLMCASPEYRIDIPPRAFQDYGVGFGGPFLCKTGSSKEAKIHMPLLFVLPAVPCTWS